MLHFCSIMEYTELPQFALFGSAVLLLGIVFKRIKGLFTAGFKRLLGCQREKRNGRKVASISTKHCEYLSGSSDGVDGKKYENSEPEEVAIDIEVYDTKEDGSRKADEDDKETVVESDRDVEDREQGIFHLHDVEEYQGDVEKTYIGTVCEEEKKRDVKKSTWKGSLWSLNRASQKNVPEDEKKSTWKGSRWSMRRVSQKSETDEREEEGSWRGSLWSLMSLSKELDSFKEVIFDRKASLFYDVKGRWEKLGSGNLIISLDRKGRAELEMFDEEEQVIRHPVRRETQLVPAKGTDRSYVWTTEAYLKREKKAKKITLFVRFPEAHTANLFQREFHTAQSEATHSKKLSLRKKKNKGKMKEVFSEEREDTISLDSRFSEYGGDCLIVDEEY